MANCLFFINLSPSWGVSNRRSATRAEYLLNSWTILPLLGKTRNRILKWCYYGSIETRDQRREWRGTSGSASAHLAEARCLRRRLVWASGASLMQVPSTWVPCLSIADRLRLNSGCVLADPREAPRVAAARRPRSSSGTAGPSRSRGAWSILPRLLARVPEQVVVDHAGDVGPGREPGLERPLDRLLQRAPVDLVLHLAGEGHLLERADEVPVLGGRVHVADDLDLARVAAAEAQLVGEADELAVAQRVEAHQLGGHGVDGHLVGRGEDARSSRAGSCSAGRGRRRRRCRPSPRRRRGGSSSGSSAGRPASRG